MAIRVLHCDDSEAFTRLVAFWLAEHGDIHHVGAAHTAESALAALPGSRPDIVLLDTMGGPGDNTLLQAIRAAVPDAAVIVYSGYVRLMHDGALGSAADAYLSKSDEDDELVAVIRSVAARRLGL
jgi:DNA-binding NarL/FixJ family response regulator